MSQEDVPPAAPRAAPSAPALDPEVLARLVVQFREFRLSLERLAPQLPRREEAPFLYKQLEDAFSRLGATIHALGTNATDASREALPSLPIAPAKAERRGILGRLLRRRKDAGEAPAPKDEVKNVDLQGTSWTIPVSELLSFLALSHKTGALWIHTPQETFMVEMRAGRLVHATSDCTPEGGRLGDILVALGKIQANEVQPCVAEARQTNEAFGAHLVRMGRISAQELREALGIQVQSLFHRLITSENAVYRFQEGLNVSENRDLELNVTSLLLESARFHDELAIPQREKRSDEAAAA